MAGKAGLAVILRNHHSKSTLPLILNHCRKWPPLWPVHGEKLRGYDVRFPSVRARPPISNKARRRRIFNLGLSFSAYTKFFIDKPGEHRRNEAFESNTLRVQHRLILVHHLNDGVHLRTQKPAMTGCGIDRFWVVTCFLPVALHTFGKHAVAAVISGKQGKINDPSIGDKDLDAMLARSIAAKLSAIIPLSSN
jgi:hypothetical protein